MSESRRITLETQVDTTGAREGFEQIKREAGAMANAVRTASKPAQDGVSSIGDGASSSASKVAAAERNLIGSIQRTTASLQSGSKSSAEYYESLARQRGIDPAVLDPYLDQLREQERLQEKAKVSVGGVKSQMNEFGVSTGQTTAALRQLPAQLSDIVSSLAGGQSPFMVLIQQGGQIKDSFGGVEAAIGGIGGAFKGLFSTTASGAGAMAGLAGNQAEVAEGAQQVAEGMQQATEGITGAADSVNELSDATETAKNALAGLRNLPPTTVFNVGLATAAASFVSVAVVVGALAVAYNRGSNEAGAFSRAIILSGNAVGATASQLNEVGRQIGAVTGDRGAAATAINELVATGEVSIENMRRFAAVAIDVETVMGRSIADTAKEFEALGKDPLDALNKINEKYGFVTSATYSQVKALKDQGKASEAASVAQNAYADGIDKQKSKVLDTLSDWERGWIRIKKEINGAADSVVDFAMGRNQTDFEKLNDLLKDQAIIQKNLDIAQQRNWPSYIAAYKEQLATKTSEINKIREGATASKDAAKNEADTAQANKLKNKYLDEANILLTRREQLTQALAAADNEGAENKLTPDEIEKRKAVIRKQFDDVAVEGIERQINARQRLSAIEDERSQRRLLQINAERSAGDLTEDAALRKTAQEEIAAIDRHIADKKDELAKLRGKSNSGIEQDSVGGEIDVLAEQRITRKNQLEIDLASAQRQRAADSNALEIAGIVKAEQERDSLQLSVKAQREYNEEIGLTADEVLSLRIQRQEALAVLKDESAAAEEAIEPGGKLAQIYRDQAKAIRDKYMADREGADKQKDPMINLRLSLAQYVEDSKNAGSGIGEALVSSFRSAEDAFAGFVTTGKIGFASLATSIISSMARIAAQRAIAGLASMAIKSLFPESSGSTGSSGFGYDYGPLAGARALGGPVNSGASYLVGERGPEIFTPSSAGSITPNNMLGSMGGSAGVTINLVTNIDGGSSGTQASGDSDAQARAVADSLNAQMKQVVAKESRQGGTIWNLMQGRG